MSCNYLFGHLLSSLARARALDDFLNHILHVVPIAGVDRKKVGLEVGCDFVQLSPARCIMHECESYTDAAKPTRATNSVEVRLGIGVTPRISRYILQNISQSFAMRRQ